MIQIITSYLNVIKEYLIAVYRDLLGLFLILGVKNKLKLFDKNKSNVFKEFEKLVKSNPNKPCIIFNDKTWTYKDLEIYCNQIAYLFSTKFDLKKGDCVALFMENKPEYVGIWLGLSKLGIISALINTNLKSESLSHSINISKAKVIIFSSSLEESIENVKKDLDKNVSLVVEGGLGKTKDSISLESLFKNLSSEIIEPALQVTANDVILYIYTSGTTGLPKPAVIKQSRYYAGALSFFKAAGLTKNDTVFLTLPIYHGNGNILGVGSAISSGATIVMRKKFSASNFWKECIQYNCTAFIYVGEICRFLVNQPPSELDQKHKVRKAFGNGLRANVWKEFDKRFNVKCYEFYAASEGNCTMINTMCRLGSCGFLPLLSRKLKFLYPVFVIKIDSEMNPIRDENGFCIECKPGEKGLLIGIIGRSPTTAYEGYANNKQASTKKIIENVFKPGQKAFNSGDMMMFDRYGYMYFCDRLGDTYRWRGENVATIEVENAISKHLNSSEVVVYGVEIPGQEGRAGMACLAGSADEIDLLKLSEKLKNDLPAYAKPLFIRFVKELEHTGSFKAKKTKLVEESYNVKLVNDQIFYHDSKEQQYKELSESIYENIINGNVRF